MITLLAIVAMILAAIVFLLDLLGAQLGDVHLVTLGLFLMALAFALSWCAPYRGERRPL